MRRILVMLAGLVLLTVAVYWPVCRFPFVDFDDPDYVTKNLFVQSGLTASTLHYAFTTYTMGNWNPLLWVSFFLDKVFFQLRPGVMHAENVLLHLIAGLLLWRLLFVSTGSLNRSFVVAGLFLVHPMHVESVAWISERKDVLSTPLLISAMLMYAWYCKQQTGQRWLAYTVMLVLFVLSLMVKSMGVTLPAILLLMDFWPLARWPGRSWIQLGLEKIPLLMISASVSVVSGVAQRHSGATASMLDLNLMDRIGNALVCYAIYISKLLVPINLVVFYKHPGHRPFEQVFASTGLLVFITWFVFKLRKRAPFAIVGWLWFIGTLVPVIGIVQVGGQAMADRYSYLPSIGFFILIVWAAADLLRRPALQNACAAIAVGVGTILAFVQVGYWCDSETLFTHVLAAADDAPVAHVMLGNIAVKRNQPHRAVDEFNKALAFGPYAPADFALGDAWVTDDPPKAIAHYKKAVELAPREAAYRIGYSRALRMSNDFPEAARQAQAAIELDPDNADARNEFGKVEHHDPG